MWTIIAAVVALVVAIVLIKAANQPDIFTMARSAVMKAPADKIFPYLNDPRKNQEWSPFDKKDWPIERTFTGAAEGVGAVYDFVGNGKEIGTGRITITESVPSSKVVMSLDMTKPMAASNVVTYTLTPKDGTTEVTWAMEGRTPFVGKIFHVFMNMEKMMGTAFETGLADLKAIVER